jgi:hypothetical protein
MIKCFTLIRSSRHSADCSGMFYAILGRFVRTLCGSQSAVHSYLWPTRSRSYSHQIFPLGPTERRGPHEQASDNQRSQSIRQDTATISADVLTTCINWQHRELYPDFADNHFQDFHVTRFSSTRAEVCAPRVPKEWFSCWKSGPVVRQSLWMYPSLNAFLWTKFCQNKHICSSIQTSRETGSSKQCLFLIAICALCGWWQSDRHPHAIVTIRTPPARRTPPPRSRNMPCSSPLLATPPPSSPLLHNNNCDWL